MTTVGRRDFLGLGAAFAALGVTAARGATAGGAKGKCRLTAGVFTDLHMTKDPRSGEIVEKALRYFVRNGAEAVLCTGDFTDYGLDEEMVHLTNAWAKVFPGGVNARGRTVERVFITGNHDVGVQGSTGKDGVAIRRTELFGEPIVPFFVKKVNGITFLCQNWCVGSNEEMIAYVRAHADELRRERVFFHLKHSHLRNTIRYAWVTDDGKVTEVLRDFPNCVSLSGHSHWPLVDERSLWQGEFTAVNCGHMRYCDVGAGRENAQPLGIRSDETQAMEQFARVNEAQCAMMMRVYDNAIVFERWDVKGDRKLGDDWVVPWPISRGSVSYETRAAALPAPQFARDAKVSVRFGKGKNRAHRMEDQVFVEFPNCRRADGSPARALDFEVAIQERLGDALRIRCSRRFYSPGFFRAEADDVGQVTCAFHLSDLPTAPTINDGPERITLSYRFLVTPWGGFGKAGEPIASDWTDLKGTYGK